MKEYMRLRREDKNFRDAENKKSLSRKLQRVEDESAMKENNRKVKKGRKAIKETPNAIPRTQAEIKEVNNRINKILKENLIN